MRSRWDYESLREFAATCPPGTAMPFVEQVFATRLLGADPDLALHGGGNTSFKGKSTDLLGEEVECLFVKASGCDMAGATVDDFVALDLKRLRRLDRDMELGDETMAAFFRSAAVLPHSCQPSIETLLHAFLPFACIDHTHPSSILAIADRTDAERCISEAFSAPIAVIPYATVGIGCARAVAEAVRKTAGCKGVVILHHGLVTWGETAREAYEATIDLVCQADAWLDKNRKFAIALTHDAASLDNARKHYRLLAPIVRGCLTPSVPSRGNLRPAISMVHLAAAPLLSFLDAQEAAVTVVSTPLTPDYIIRTGRLPALIERPALDDPSQFRSQTVAACSAWREEYSAFIGRYGGPSVKAAADNAFPSVILIPGIGAICTGSSLREARVAADITAQGLAVKRAVFESGGTYRNLDDEHCFNMEFRSYQRAKLTAAAPTDALYGRIVLVTGAAGAIGSGLCESLLERGCQVAASDLPEAALDALVDEFATKFGSGRITAVPMDVSEEGSVREGFGNIVEIFGGLDAVVVNAGIAHVSTLAEMEIDAFRKLERVNTEGVLLTIREAARLFTLQNTGGDIVLISTKNVFAPGASFGAYSATKAAAHQLARIASQELAGIDVRVNMVSPDAVFSHGTHKSGLWATVGPGRMKSRGLDEAGLEEYYRNRNLLKSKVTASHVAAAVEFFLERRTPTTGATIPVDGGLPDATPR